MLEKKEIINILIITLIIGFLISITSFSTTKLLFSLLSIFLIISINILAKKITSHFAGSKIKINLWEMNRYGVKIFQKFKKPVPTGVLFPFILTILSAGFLTWLANFTFEIQPLKTSAKRLGLYTFTEISEFQTGIVASSGIIANLCFAIIGYLINLPSQMQFVQLSLLMAFFNLIPFSDLDGHKIFFGNSVLWSVLAALTLIGIFFAIIII